MALNHNQLSSLPHRSRPYKKGLGGGLFVLVDKEYKSKDGSTLGGRKYFKGRVKGEEIWIGPFGNKAGEYSLAEARSKFHDIKDICHKQQITFKEYKRRLEKEELSKWTLNDAIDHWLNQIHSTIKGTTYREYARKLKQVLSHIDGSTPLEELEIQNDGKKKINFVIKQIEDGGKGCNWDAGDRCKMLLKQVFEEAEEQGYMTEGQNPSARKSKFKKHKINHHPHITWEQVPELLERVSLNPIHAHPFSQLATKFMLLTFLRAGALTRLEWNWIDESRDLLVLPGTTSGLKRRKDLNDDIPHHLPITSHIKSILDYAMRFNNGEKYIFLPMRESRFEHLDPSAPNNYLRNLGYKDIQRAHGWRSVALTNGIDLLKTPKEVIKKQLGHLPDNKVDQAYDKSLMLEERRTFLEKWGGLLVNNGLEI